MRILGPYVLHDCLLIINMLAFPTAQGKRSKQKKLKHQKRKEKGITLLPLTLHQRLQLCRWGNRERKDPGGIACHGSLFILHSGMGMKNLTNLDSSTTPTLIYEQRTHA